MVTLEKLLSGVDVVHVDEPGVTVEDISWLPNDIKPGWAYVSCDLPDLPGDQALDEAVQLGASVVVVGKETTLPAHSQCRAAIVRDANKAYSTMCANYFGNAHRDMSVYAVTGTAGKTSTCYLLDSIFKSAGIKTGLIGTVVRKIGDLEMASPNTTPDPYELHWLFREMRAADVTHVILEASSIGITEERLWGLEFSGMVFTNIGHEHLTYHGGLENYQKAKGRLFTEYASAQAKRPVCAINVDDSFGDHLASIAEGEVVTFGVKGEFNGAGLVLDETGIYGEVGGVPIRSPLIGPHNVYNILGAVALSRKIGIDAESIAVGVSRLRQIPGRFERVGGHNGVDVFVDYAHTPESVWVVLTTLREIFAGRQLITILGCGGNSDAAKRPVMARIAVDHSEVCIFTTDNPRQEDPLNILNDMLKGIDPEGLIAQGRLEIIMDRREAIQRGVEIIKGGGVLIILGKGHERFQIIGDRKIPCDDREIAGQVLGLQLRETIPRETD